MQWQTKLPLIAILRGIKPDEALAHVGAVIDAGFDAVEIPLNSPQWEQSIPAIVDAYGDKALIGAGTVLKPEQVDALARMGCQLIVTPNIHSEVIRRAVGYGMTVCPGCATATEAFTALEAGAQALKIFPSSAFGPQYIKALKAVLPRSWNTAPPPLLRRARRTLSSSIRRVLHSFHGFCARPITTVSALRQRNRTRCVAGIWRKIHSSTARLNHGS